MKKITGDLISLAENGHFDVIIQGCNCWNVMGSGLAGQIKSKYVQAYNADCKTKRGDYNKLGNYSFVEVESKKKQNYKFTIVNAYTQYGFSKGEDVFEYTSFALILQKLSYQFACKKLGFPLIGCGLAGGNESAITGLLSAFADDFEDSGGSCTLVEFL